MRSLKPEDFESLKKLLGVLAFLILIIVCGSIIYLVQLSGIFHLTNEPIVQKPKAALKESKITEWKLISMDAVVHENDPELIRYGQKLIANTAYYLGPKGKVKAMSNGMNCQNCHLEAGTKIWGNNYGAVAANYPKVRPRSGKMTDISMRINGCFQRSLNGLALDTNSREMKAMVAYIKFLGQFVEKDTTPNGSGIWKLAFLNRPADPEKGKVVYSAKCVTCHGENGQGVKNEDGINYTYPPLWGEHSYNHGAGLFRLSKLAGYVKTNMPFGVTYEQPQLSDEEAWDVAAYVNSQPRPKKDLSKDWPNIALKPIDHPFGPFADPFNEQQHKYGPFKEIEDYRKRKQEKTKTI